MSEVTADRASSAWPAAETRRSPDELLGREAGRLVVTAVCDLAHTSWGLTRAPLYWRRIRLRDAALAAAVAAAVTVWIARGGLPRGSLGAFVEAFRFNGPLFTALETVGRGAIPVWMWTVSVLAIYPTWHPILLDEADLVLGARGGHGRPWHAHLGTGLCVWLINRLWRTRYADLGPFRAIRGSSLRRLQMRDETWGWTIEMQVKAAECGLRILEMPVASGPRVAGRSKISGSLVGTVRAAGRMLAIIARLRLTRRRRTLSSGQEASTDSQRLSQSP